MKYDHQTNLKLNMTNLGPEIIKLPIKFQFLVSNLSILVSSSSDGHKILRLWGIFGFHPETGNPPFSYNE